MCRSWQPIRPSRKLDTLSEETARQIAGNNAAQSTWCGKPVAIAEARK